MIVRGAGWPESPPGTPHAPQGGDTTLERFTTDVHAVRAILQTVGRQPSRRMRLESFGQSLPSVSTTTARRRPSRPPTRRAVNAMASWSDVAPNGFTSDSTVGSVLSPVVNGVRSSRCVSNV